LPSVSKPMKVMPLPSTDGLNDAPRAIF
jgi:hypothetical protein